MPLKRNNYSFFYGSSPTLGEKLRIFAGGGGGLGFCLVASLVEAGEHTTEEGMAEIKKKIKAK